MFRDRSGRAVGVMLLLQGVVEGWVAAMTPFLVGGVGPGDDPPHPGQQVQTEHAIGLSLVLLLLLALTSAAAGVGMVRGPGRPSLLVAAGVLHLGAAVVLATAGAVFLAAGALLGATTVALAAVVQHRSAARHHT